MSSIFQIITLFFILFTVNCTPVANVENPKSVIDDAAEVYDQYGKPVVDAISNAGKSIYENGVNFVNDEKTKEAVNNGLATAGEAIKNFGNKIANVWNSWF